MVNISWGQKLSILSSFSEEERFTLDDVRGTDLCKICHYWCHSKIGEMAGSAGASGVPKKDGFYDKFVRNYQILTPWQLKKLSEHKYSASGISLFEPPMQVFWRWLVEQVPLWWAPNAITIVGLLINVLTTLILAYYSPDCKQEVRNLV